MNYSVALKSNAQNSKSSDYKVSTVAESAECTSLPESILSEKSVSSRNDTEDDLPFRNGVYVFTRVNSKRKKYSINIIGDSTVRHITKIMDCSNEDSGCIARGGARIRLC